MKQIVMGISVLVLFALGSMQTLPAWAQSAELSSAFKQYQSLNKQRKYVEAIFFAKIFIKLAKAEFGETHKVYASGLLLLGELYENQGRDEEAEALYTRLLVTYEKALGPDHKNVGRALNYLARFYEARDRYGEAEPLYTRSLAILEKAFGPDSKIVASAFNNLARFYEYQGRFYENNGRYGEAEPTYMRSLATYEKALGPDHPNFARTLNKLAGLYEAQGRYEEAEPLYTRSLAIKAKAFGPDHMNVARALNNLARFYEEQGRFYEAQGHYGKAEPLYKRSLAIREQALGPDHPDVASALHNLAKLYQAQGRYGEAEPLYKRSFAIDEKTLSPDHPDVATALNDLAVLYQAQGRYGEAEPLHKRSLVIDEKAFGSDHLNVFRTLNNLANLYQAQGRYGDAEPLYKRSLSIGEQALGPEHPSVATSLNNLAKLYKAQGRYSEAESLYKRTLAIDEKTGSPDHPDVATTLNNLAGLYEAQGRYEEAEPLYTRSLAIKAKAFGSDHHFSATALNNLAELYRAQGRYWEAEPLYKRSLQTYEEAFGSDHLSLVALLGNLAILYQSQKQHTKALSYTRRSTRILKNRFSEMSRRNSEGLQREQRAKKGYFHAHADFALLEGHSEPRLALEGEAFEALQLAGLSGAGDAINRMSARSAAGGAGDLIRSYQDGLRRYQALDKNLIDKLGKNTQAGRDAVAAIRDEITKVEAELSSLEGRIRTEFPRYADLIRPEPLKIEDVQSLLRPGEGLLTFIRSWKGDQTHVFVISEKGQKVYTTDLSEKQLSEMTALLRKGLDTSVRRVSDLPEYDVGVAHALYKKLLGPAEEMLSGIKHLFVVPTGALESLPLNVLVASLPEGGVGSLAANDNRLSGTRGIEVVRTQQQKQDFLDYGRVDWLVKRFAITTLPSVSSLRSLRKYGKKGRAEDPFIGFGDPVLSGDQGKSKGLEMASLYRGVIADVDAVRKLPSLPDTAKELRDIASYLGAGEESIFLRERATETRVKETTLDRSRVVAFSTHGLVNGEIKGLSEPALVLTPPKEGSDLDDGLLTASEITNLKLNADWVILSACNTASGEKPGAEGLSGLARSFFYAGARALLVSHWPVESTAATRLTTKMFEALQSDPTIGRSEALRRSMMSLASNDNYSHPALWAPFVVVGEGGGQR